MDNCCVANGGGSPLLVAAPPARAARRARTTAAKTFLLSSPALTTPPSAEATKGKGTATTTATTTAKAAARGPRGHRNRYKRRRIFAHLALGRCSIRHDRKRQEDPRRVDGCRLGHRLPGAGPQRSRPHRRRHGTFRQLHSATGSPREEGTGFNALAVYDLPANGGNGDGWIDFHDAIYPKLLLWIDKNHNGISEPDELFTLPQLGIARISLSHQEDKWKDAHGNVFRRRAQVVTARSLLGKENWASDVMLRVAK